MLSILFVWISHISLTVAQPSSSIASLDPAECVPGSGITTFAACNYMWNHFTTCSSYADAHQSASWYNCFCEQRMFNAIWDCNSEERLCAGNNDVDAIYRNTFLPVWHSQCDTKINSILTTPRLSPITATYITASYNQICSSVSSNCASLNAVRTACVNSASDVATASSGFDNALASCLCKPSRLSLAYDCSVLGNVSCLQIPAALTGMAEYGHCSNLADVLTVPPSLTASLTVSTGYPVVPSQFSSSSTKTIAQSSKVTNTNLFPGHASTMGTSASVTATPTSGGVLKYTPHTSLWALSFVMLLNSLGRNVCRSVDRE